MASTPISQYYLLRWNDHLSNYGDIFLTLREQEEFVDCSIACEDGIVGAHRVVLAGCSPYLREVFIRISNPHPVIFLTNTPRSLVIMLLEFIYKGQVHIPQNRLQQLVMLGQSLQIKGLKQITVPMSEVPSLNTVTPVAFPHCLPLSVTGGLAYSGPSEGASNLDVSVVNNEENREENRENVEEESRKSVEEEMTRSVEEESRNSVEEESRNSVEEESRNSVEEESRKSVEEESRKSVEEESRKSVEESRKGVKEESRKSIKEGSRKDGEFISEQMSDEPPKKRRGRKKKVSIGQNQKNQLKSYPVGLQDKLLLADHAKKHGVESTISYAKALYDVHMRSSTILKLMMKFGKYGSVKRLKDDAERADQVVCNAVPSRSLDYI